MSEASDPIDRQFVRRRSFARGTIGTRDQNTRSSAMGSIIMNKKRKEIMRKEGIAEEVEDVRDRKNVDLKERAESAMLCLKEREGRGRRRDEGTEVRSARDTVVTEKSITLDELTSASMKSRKQEKPFFKKEKDELKKSYL
uniref:Uncharacterized protein n=1 Tax=Pristionchus pacificus TaxID=54126 RepID=A0A2A6BDK8_PRIPA|eukprot:PDM63962.1 hypothetical protein PRIPAC_49463 [Pristionchus pacificus]